MSNYNYQGVYHEHAAGSSTSARPVVHIEEQAQARTQSPRAYEIASAASERESSSGGESSGVNFMAQRPLFQVQLPVNEKFADRAPYGSGDFDDGYTLEFESLGHFMEWRNKVEEEDIVEFVKGDSHGSKADPPRFKEHVKLVCARHNRSGRKTYVKKYPERQRKVPSRKLGGDGCAAFISYKTYHNTEKVRAMYHSQHSHEIGLANLQFTRKGRKAEEARKKQGARGQYRSNSHADTRLASVGSSSSLRASSSQPDDVNITIDSGDPYPVEGSSELLGAFGHSGMAGSQHHSYLDALPQLPASPFSPTHPSSLLLQEGPYQATHSHHYQAHLMTGAQLDHNSSSSVAGYGSLSLTTNNIHAVDAQPPSAGPHTPVHSAVVSPFGPVSPSEVYATPDQLLTPFHQTRSFGAFDTLADQALSVIAANASPHSSNSYSSGSSRAQSHPHSSPNGPPLSPLHPHPSSSTHTQLLIDALAQQQAQPVSAHDAPPLSAVGQHQPSATGSRIDRLVENVQSLRTCAQSTAFEFSEPRLNRLEDAVKELWNEMQMVAYQSENQAPAQAFASASQIGANVHALAREQTHDHSVFTLPSGTGYNQFLPQIDYAQASASQGMHMHASATSATNLHLDVSGHGLQPHSA